MDEPEKQVKKAICQFIAHVANHELPNNNWNQLIQFLEEVNTSNDLAQREVPNKKGQSKVKKKRL